MRDELKCLDVYQKFLKQHDKLAAKQQSKFNNTNICRHNFLIFFIIYGNLKPFIFLYRDIIWNMAKKKKSLTPIIHPLILMQWIFLFLWAVTALRRNWYSVYVVLNCEIWSLRKQSLSQSLLRILWLTLN